MVRGNGLKVVIIMDGTVVAFEVNLRGLEEAAVSVIMFGKGNATICLEKFLGGPDVALTSPAELF